MRQATMANTSRDVDEMRIVAAKNHRIVQCPSGNLRVISVNHQIQGGSITDDKIVV